MSTYQDRVNAGLCGKCGEERDSDGSLCSQCREQARKRAAEKRAKHRAAGACINCGASCVGVRCERCKATAKASRNRSIRKRKLSGQCTACSNPAKPGCSLCQACIDKRSAVSSAHYQRRKAAGLCYYCNRPPATGSVLCDYHKAKTADYRLRLKLAAFDVYGGPFCSQCGNTDITILEVDHVNGGGCQHRKKVTNGAGGHPFYQWLKQNNYPDGFRVLCPTCNKKAHVQARACP